MRPLVFLFAPLLLATAYCQKEADGKDDALALALISNNWSWEPTVTGKKESQEIQFYPGGIAENRRYFSCSWEIIAPRTVLLQNTNNSRDNGKLAHLVFDAEFKHFVGMDFDGKSVLEGFRREPLDPKRPIPPPRDPIGK
jgi:hypothetical protein